MNKLKTFKYKTKADDAGLLDKISKRYSTYRFLRKSPCRKNAVEQPVSGSYDMTGHESDDHKVEIGAPVLISKTTIDSDHVADGSSGACINDGVRVSSSERSIAGSSFGGELKFSFFAPSAKNTGGDDDEDQDYDIPRPFVMISGSDKNDQNKPTRSKSAANLHRVDEPKCRLQRVPSLTECKRSTDAETATFTASAFERLSGADCATVFSKTPAKFHSISNICENDVPIARSTPIAQQQHEQTASQLSMKRASNLTVDDDRGHSKTRDSLDANSSIGDDEFDLKSASCHSLNARNIFLSMEELNDITKQINEAEELQSKDDELEYCAHRDNLRPVERRITLLRNKNNRLINIGSRRDKFTNAWSGFKMWVGEEKSKLRGVVQRHVALQRVGANLKSNSGSSTTLAAARTDAGNNIVRNQDFFDQIGASGGECSIGGSQAGSLGKHCPASTDPDSASEFSSLDGDCRKKRRSSENKKDETDGGQSRGRPSKEGWEVNSVCFCA